MQHPTTRAERRAQRERVIARRRFVWEVIWCSSAYEVNNRNNPEYGSYAGWHPEWGRYTKWNMNCGCTLCHSAKYYKLKARRRYLRNQAFSTAECRNGDRKIYG